MNLISGGVFRIYAEYRVLQGLGISNNEESNGDVEMKKQIFDTPHILHE